ncbi:MAG: copper-binding protein [Gammaproteobacteria bacterium]|nr:copper-binding protein [Gammaproteobacteria bacterium]
MPEETLRGEQIATPTPTPTPPAQVPEKSPHATLPPGSDGRGIVRSVNLEQRKVKLKHGPIQKLDMPGMTMIFRVKDPALLKQIKAGEEVGFTIEMEGSTFYITGFQKEGR